MKLININSNGQNPCQFSCKIPTITIPPDSEIGLLKGRLSQSGEIDINDTNNTFVIQWGAFDCDYVDPADADSVIEYMENETIRIPNGTYRIYGADDDIANTLSEAITTALKEQSAYKWWGYEANYSSGNNRQILIRAFLKKRFSRDFLVDLGVINNNLVLGKQYVRVNNSKTLIKLDNDANFFISHNECPLPYDSRDETAGGAGDWSAHPLFEMKIPAITDIATHFKGAGIGLALTDQKYGYDDPASEFRWNRKTGTSIAILTPFRINVSQNTGNVNISLYNHQDGHPTTRINTATYTFPVGSRLTNGKAMKISIYSQMKSDNGFQFQVVVDNDADGTPNIATRDVFIPNEWISTRGWYLCGGLWQTEDEDYETELNGVVDIENLVDDFSQKIGYIDKIGVANTFNNQSLGTLSATFFLNKVEEDDEFYTVTSGASEIYVKVSPELAEMSEECNVSFIQNRAINDTRDRNFTINDSSPSLFLFIDNAFSITSTIYNININNLQLESYFGDKTRGEKSNCIHNEYGADYDNNTQILFFEPTNPIYLKLTNTEVMNISNLDITITNADGQLLEVLSGTTFLTFYIRSNDNRSLLRQLVNVNQRTDMIENQIIEEKLNKLANGI